MVSCKETERCICLRYLLVRKGGIIIAFSRCSLATGIPFRDKLGIQDLFELDESVLTEIHNAIADNRGCDSLQSERPQKSSIPDTRPRLLSARANTPSLSVA